MAADTEYNKTRRGARQSPVAGDNKLTASMSRGSAQGKQSKAGSDPKVNDSMYYESTENFGNNKSQEQGSPNPWLVFLHLLIAPRVGWRRMKKAAYSPDDFARTVFYPLLALMAACRFVEKLYYYNVSTGPLLQKAIAGFVAFFGGYFLICLLARTFLPTASRLKIDTRFGHVYIMSVLSVLALTAIIAELLPWLGMLLVVPPLYGAYILAKGLQPLRVPERETVGFTTLMIVLCGGVPLGIYYALVMMMPHA